MKMKNNKLMIVTLMAFLLMGLSTSQTNAQTPIKGLNVTKVTFGNNNKVEGILVQVEPKKWNHYYPDGKRLWTTHTETGRDEWSVYLTNGKLVVVVNLWKKTVTYSKQMNYTGPVLSSSNDPIGSSTNPKPPSPLPAGTPKITEVFTKTGKAKALSSNKRSSNGSSNESNLTNVAYGIFVKTWNPTNVPPEIQIYGDKGTSRTVLLENKWDNLNKGGSDYYVFSGQEMGNVGTPIAIGFKARSDDGWGFIDVKVDYYKGKQSNWDANAWATRVKDLNQQSIVNLLDSDKFELTTISFPGKKGVDSNEGFAENIKHNKIEILSANGSGLDTNKRGAKAIELPPIIRVSTQFIVVENQNNDEYKLTSTQIKTLTSDDVFSAVDTYAEEKGFSNKTTVGATAGTEVEMFGAKVSLEFKVENETTVLKNDIKTSQNSSGGSGGEASGVTNEQAFTIPAGSVVILKLDYNAKVKQYSDFANLIRIEPVQDLSINISAKTYKVDCQTGELRLFLITTNSSNASTERLGPKLSDDKEMLDVIKLQNPNFKTKSPINGECWSHSEPAY